jgi:hypothetical protein
MMNGAALVEASLNTANIHGLAVLYYCTCHEEDPWYGWLPVDEVKEV